MLFERSGTAILCVPGLPLEYRLLRVMYVEGGTVTGRAGLLSHAKPI